MIVQYAATILYLHSTVVLLKRSRSCKNLMPNSNLHSTVVLLKLTEAIRAGNYYEDLHSTVVLLKLGTVCPDCPQFVLFTFYCSSIKTIGFQLAKFTLNLFTFYCSSIKTEWRRAHPAGNAPFTFYCSSIKTHRP